MKRLIREPLLHFVLLGAAFFAASSFLSVRDEAQPDAIVLSAGKIDYGNRGVNTVYHDWRDRGEL